VKNTRIASAHHQIPLC